jgi:hypothetical protein
LDYVFILTIFLVTSSCYDDVRVTFSAGGDVDGRLNVIEVKTKSQDWTISSFHN